MKQWCALAVLLALAGSAYAAPNLTNNSQKGSLLIFPDIRVDGNWNTLVRITNDGDLDIDVKCYWMDGNKNLVNFAFEIALESPVWFDARTGQGGPTGVNTFPTGAAGGIDNPFLITPPDVTEATDGDGPYRKGLLVCFAVDPANLHQVKWNHLLGSATVFHPTLGAYEYNAYGFYVRFGLDMEPVGVAGILKLDGIDYDYCPEYQLGHFSPSLPYSPGPSPPPPALPIVATRLAVAGCKLSFTQDPEVYTKLELDLWNEEEVKFTGSYECSDSWHETDFRLDLTSNNGGGLDSAGQTFEWATFQSYAARYRVRSVASSRCPGSVQVGVLGIQSRFIDFSTDLAQHAVGTNLVNAGRLVGQVVWTPGQPVPEGGIR